jgi:hypothetical protein
LTAWTRVDWTGLDWTRPDRTGPGLDQTGPGVRGAAPGKLGPGKFGSVLMAGPRNTCDPGNSWHATGVTIVNKCTCCHTQVGLKRFSTVTVGFERQVWSGIRLTSHPIESLSRETSFGGIGIFVAQA